MRKKSKIAEDREIDFNKMVIDKLIDKMEKEEYYNGTEEQKSIYLKAKLTQFAYNMEKMTRKK